MHNAHGPHLFETRFGSVLQCTCCGRIQITFRSHTLLVDEEEFEELAHTLHRAWTQVRGAEGQNTWRLQASSDAGDVSILLPHSSLKALHGLLQGARAMYRLRNRVEAVASGAASDVLRDHVPR